MEKTGQGLATLYKVIGILGQDKDIGEMLEDVLNTLSNELGMRRGMISIVHGDQQEVQLDVAPDVAKRNISSIRYGIGEGVTGRVVATGRPMAIPNIDEDPQFLDRSGMRTEIDRSDLAFICVPIKYSERVIGALSVDTVASASHSLDEEVYYLGAIADLIARRVNSRRLEKERKELIIENELLRSRVEDNWRPQEMIGNSKGMREIYSLIHQVADSNTSVLITGETGTGKELAAAAIHHSSPRRDGPFVRVNCSVFPENLLENELFGHEKGAYTGAGERYIGRFERAHGGTIFLDEIGEITQSAQVKLLRILQDKEIERVGGTEPIKVNVRVVAATNRDLEDAAKKGEFRLDLFYRLNVFPIYLPPLRERGADIMMLADHFVQKYAKELNKDVSRICTPAIEMLMSYHWPGNVRELENCIERAVLLAKDDTIHSYELPPSLQMETENIKGIKGGSLEKMVAAYELDLILQELKNSRGNQSEAARRLGTTKRIMQYKIRKYNIDCTKFKSESKR